MDYVTANFILFFTSNIFLICLGFVYKRQKRKIKEIRDEYKRLQIKYDNLIYNLDLVQGGDINEH